MSEPKERKAEERAVKERETERARSRKEAEEAKQERERREKQAQEERRRLRERERGDGRRRAGDAGGIAGRHQGLGVKVVNSADELENLFRRLSAGGKPVQGTTYPGGRFVELPDGTTVGIRAGSKSGGPTIDITLSDKEGDRRARLLANDTA
ncbi:MAG TPA: hypothetical protein VK459_12840 [Polyangiaceae bacterium]|jgi:hypothetical protein|nr:hypothetical protein [Polyangiaceae bacterium]